MHYKSTCLNCTCTFGIPSFNCVIMSLSTTLACDVSSLGPSLIIVSTTKL